MNFSRSSSGSFIPENLRSVALSLLQNSLIKFGNPRSLLFAQVPEAIVRESRNQSLWTMKACFQVQVPGRTLGRSVGRSVGRLAEPLSKSSSQLPVIFWRFGDAFRRTLRRVDGQTSGIFDIRLLNYYAIMINDCNQMRVTGYFVVSVSVTAATARRLG